MNKPQTVGLLMGVYNEAHRMKECLEYHLPYFDDAVIVIQQSDDGTEEEVKDFFRGWEPLNLKLDIEIDHLVAFEVYQDDSKIVKVLHFPKMGCSEATLQDGVNVMTSDWVLYCDADEKFPVPFLKKMHDIVRDTFYNGYRFERDNWFDVQVFNEAVPIEPKNILVKHPARDQQVRLTRKSMSVFPRQVHVRARVRDESGDEKIKSLDYAMYHLKSLDEQWIDNKAYMDPVKQVERFEQAKKEAKEKGLSIENIKLSDY